MAISMSLWREEVMNGLGSYGAGYGAKRHKCKVARGFVFLYIMDSSVCARSSVG
jgi:hypothetical protein